MKEVLFSIKKKLVAFAKLQGRKLRRVVADTTLGVDEAFQVPIVINNYNRCTYLKDLVDWLQQAGYTNIFILDNDSQYPALLDYYKHTTAKVIYLKKNVGYKALWQTDLFETLKSRYYVYTDSDLLPTDNCPKDLVYQLYRVLRRYSSVEKCGPALRIDDLPDHYALKEKVLANERPFWTEQPEPNVFIAPIDTTFALYRPFAYGDAEDCKAMRVDGSLTFIHRPWYENSARPDEETAYYMSHAGSSSFWYNKVNNTTVK